MKTLFDKNTLEEIQNRLQKLTPETKAKWGKMSINQMLAHCQEPILVSLGEKTLKKPNFLMKMIYSRFKKSLYDDIPWKQGLPTAPAYRVFETKNFETERSQLLELIHKIYLSKNKTHWPEHPIFGQYTGEQIGKMQYKHLNHHFRQFGV